MKILKPGREQKGWAVEAECTGNGNGGGGCGSLLLVEEDDIRITTRNCRDETDYFSTFKCASCGVDTDLKPEQVPMRVWSKARARAKEAP